MPVSIPAPIVVRMTKPTDTPTPAEYAGDRQPGPFFDRTTTTYKIAPIEITVVKNRESSHVPPPDEDKDCGCNDAPDYASMVAMGANAARAVMGANVPPPTVAPDLDMDK